MIRPLVTTNLIQLQAFEPDRLLEAVRGARLEHYLLNNVLCSARLSRWNCGSFSVDVGSYNFPVRVIGEFPGDRICIGYMRRISQPSRVNGFSCDLETLEFYPEKAELNYRAAQGGEWVLIEFSREDILHVARERLGQELALPWKHAVSLPMPLIRRIVLDRMIQQLWIHPFSGAKLMTAILEFIAEFLQEAAGNFAQVVRPSLLKREAMLIRADQYIKANSTRPFDLDALARAAGVNVRTLQREFLSAYGMPPHKWMRCLMLHAVRKRLRSLDRRKFTVEAIAQEAGFRHMGRFSKHYHELFGEHPSRTVPAI